MNRPAVFARILRLFIPPAVVVALDAILSLGFDAYTLAPALDIPMHFVGGVAIAYTLNGFLALAEDASLIHVAHSAIRVLLVVCFVNAAATGWEFLEFVAGWNFGAKSQKYLANTLSDMLFGILGGGLFVVVLVMRQGRDVSTHRRPENR